MKNLEMIEINEYSKLYNQFLEKLNNYEDLPKKYHARCEVFWQAMEYDDLSVEKLIIWVNELKSMWHDAACPEQSSEDIIDGID